MEVSGMPRGEVLVMDGEPTVRAMVQGVLEDEGYTVQALADATVGLQVLQESPVPMTVLCDVVPLEHRPRAHSGMALLDALRQEAEAAATHQLRRHRYVLMSTNPQWALTRAGRLPPDVLLRVLEKPFSMGELRATVLACSKA
jgi:CheY-like chemotaxis protein